jgi:hypothetical protein
VHSTGALALSLKIQPEKFREFLAFLSTIERKRKSQSDQILRFVTYRAGEFWPPGRRQGELARKFGLTRNFFLPRCKPDPIPSSMPKELPVAAQRIILKLERRILKLEQQKDQLKAKHAKQIAKLEAENLKLRTAPIPISKEQLEQIRALRQA